MIAISACLIGENVRYNGSNKLNQELQELVTQHKAISICPEVLGGLSTPRPPAEIVGGDGRGVWNDKAKVLTNTGEDVTAQFKEGALKALEVLQTYGCTAVVLKAGSPSCGSKVIYDGTLSGELKKGIGVTVALFEAHNIRVKDENNWKELL
ncbi:Uncharacterized conserved protein [Staphylococcus piscifermentans]|uniref:Purine-nucleoside phosphorylase n=1 Tax=Staphylococcus piscifermentans TaxID=70258 RepID=A0A239UJ68_9STAP|nr:DUF523 domain-containing protein [Staphylococcus piscifermentans]RTX84403.1 DUF523 domain-containing protein [Staphylococcus piscifermentans]GEP85187.1 purine-nucleoside phosphorylase [Staphylococcus piscifermentans]SNV09689.1 Uncharacterized conserved protein [Staphylococcus piscifermentans]